MANERVWARAETLRLGPALTAAGTASAQSVSRRGFVGGLQPEARALNTRPEALAGPCHRPARPPRMARRARPRRGRGPPPWTWQLVAVESGHCGNPRQTRPGPHIQVGKPSTPRRLGLSFSALPSFIAPERTTSRAPFNPMWRGPGADVARSRHSSSRRCQPKCGAHLIILTGILTSCRWTMNRSLPMSMFEIT